VTRRRQLRSSLAVLGVAGALIFVSACDQGTTSPASTEPAAVVTTTTPEADPPGLPSSDSPGAAASEGAPGTTEPTDPVAATAPGNPVITRIPDGQWKRIVQTGTWRPGCPVGRRDLRRLEIDFVTFDGTVERGVLVAHRDSIRDLADILGVMYQQGFPMERMTPVERFGGDVNRSLAANNTSAFNCRKPGQINAPVKESPHANGRAIDINPVQNPWRDPRCACWNPAGGKGTRSLEGPGVIRKGSPVVALFEERGWVWQNIDVADYMHFDTGYPSQPR